MPIKQYSKSLQMIYDDPSYYAQLLENNKENIFIKTISFETTKKAVDELLGA